MNTPGDIEALRESIAAYFGCAPEEIVGLVLGVERVSEEQGVIFSSAWSAASAWQVQGYIWELSEQQKQQTVQIAERAVEPTHNGEVEL